MVTTATSRSSVSFELALDQQLPDASAVFGRAARMPDRQLRTAYFDTADRRLWHQGFLLDHQVDEEDRGGIWTLDRSDGSDWDRLDWSGDRDDLPAPASELLLGLLRREPLRLVAELATVRRRLSGRTRPERSSVSWTTTP